MQALIADSVAARRITNGQEVQPSEDVDTEI